MLSPVLFAIDLDTILQVGVFLFIIISTLAGQIFSKNNQRGPAKGKKPRPRPERPDALGQNRPERRPQAQPWNEPVDVRVPRGQQDPLSAEPVRPEVVRAEVVPVEPVVVRESVAEHVQRHIERGRDEAPRPQSLVELADERMASHLQQAFDHRLGRLGSDAIEFTSSLTKRKALESTGELPSAAGSDIADRVAQMMQTPADLSAVIVLNEILKRPEERWNE